MIERSRIVAAAPAVLLVAIAAWESCATRRDATSVPGDDAWDAAAATVRAAHQPGDLIVFAPDWIDPVGRLHLGDLIPVAMAGRMDDARYGRIWELSIRGADAPELADAGRAVLDEDHDGVRVRRFERAPAVVTADLLERAGSAQADGPHPSVVLAEVGFAPHRCLQITPRANQPARVTFPQLPLGSTLVGYAGIADVFTRREVRTPVELDVEIGGQVVASAHPGIDDGWVRFSTPTTPGPADVTFIARAGENGRLVCFTAEARQ